MTLTLSANMLFISLFQSVIGSKFLNITFLLTLFASVSAAAVLLILMVPLTSMHASL